MENHKIGKTDMEFHIFRYMDCKEKVSQPYLLFISTSVHYMYINAHTHTHFSFCLSFSAMNDTSDPRQKEATSIKEVETHEFKIHLLKNKIATTLASKHPGNITLLQEKINSLKCKCIYTYSCEENAYFNSKKGTVSKDQILKENEVSNVCLMLLNFLMLDGEETMDSNIDTLYQQSIEHTDKTRDTDEIMTDVIFPVYEQFFANRYNKLKTDANYSDPFIYDQRFDTWASNGYRFDDNDMWCVENTSCSVALEKLATTWNNISVVMDFPWAMGFGTIIANFNYMLDSCFFLGGKRKVESRFQEGEHQWSGFENNTRGQCFFDKDSDAFYKDMAAFSSILSKTTFRGVYLNDLLGFLGYSPALDISSLKEDGYASISRNLHPIYGMDRRFIDDGYGWEPCCYRSTYQRLTRNIKISMKNRNLGVVSL